jgi:hypothetical protein
MRRQAEQAAVLVRIVAGLERRVKAMLEYAERHREAGLAEVEREAWRLSRDCFGEVVQAVIETRRQAGERQRQCECGGQLRYKGEQRRYQETLVGRVRWSRGYYQCLACGRGRYPLDEALSVAAGSFSECVQEQATRLAVELSFREAASEYSGLTGISLSARELARITEERGRVLEEGKAREREELFRGEAGPSKGRRALVCHQTWAVALDAAKVRFEDGWHEVKTGAVFWVEGTSSKEGVAKPRRSCRVKAREQSYIAQVGSMEEAGARLYAEVIERGIDPAVQLLVCLADGAPGIWSQYALHFPQRVEVLDWYHAMEHLWAAGNGTFGEGREEAKQWVASQEQLLWDGRLAEVIANLAALSLAPTGQAAREQIHYFEVNKERMRYPEFRAKGYPIGSGVVESACKRVVAARLKQAGMCWSKIGAQSVLALRTAKLSNRWDEAWLATRALPLAA